jgi:hypothetical protein
VVAVVQVLLDKALLQLKVEMVEMELHQVQVGCL